MSGGGVKPADAQASNGPPSGWARTTLGEIACIRSGFGFPVQMQGQQEGEIPFAKVSDISQAVESGSKYLTSAANFISEKEAKELRVQVLPKGAVVFAKIGGAIELNRRVLLQRPFIVDNNVMGLIPESDIGPLYLYYFMLTQRLGEISRATTVPSVRKSDIERLPIPLPPVGEQRRITNSLEELFSDLDAGIAALRRTQAKLKHYRAAVLKAAIEGRLTDEWRKQHSVTESGSELLERVLVRHGKSADSSVARDGLPSIPASWTSASIAQLISEPIINGISVRGSDNPPGIASLRLNAMTDSGFDYSARRYLPLQAEAVSDLWIRDGDFFVSRANGSKRLVGRGTQAQAPPENIIFPDTMMRLRFVDALKETRWISAIWGSSTIRSQIERAAKTTAGILKISQRDLASVTVPLPPLPEQRAIVEALDEQLPMVDHVEADIEAKLTAAQALRQSILHRAFTGRLVPQDPNDEPAEEILKRIAAERARRSSTPSRRRARTA